MADFGARRRRRLIFTMDRRVDLQGMRAIAVLAVFVNHLFGWPSGGFVGVDVFFVLSGFFITGLLLKERSKTGRVSFQNFYIRRVKRIIPSALLVLVVTVATAQFLFPSTRTKDTLTDALWAAVFGANIRFEQIGADYWAQNLPPSPIQHYWSLSIEEQFYFVWPWLLAALFLLTRKHYRRGGWWVRQWALFGAMLLVVCTSFGWAITLSATNPNVAYFSTFTRVWELGVGALTAIAGPWLTRIPEIIRPALAYVGLAGVAASLFVINPAVQFPAPWAALPVLSTALVIAAFHGSRVRAVPILTNPVARWFGDTSYTLYLWHWPVIILLGAVMPEGVAFYIVVLAIALGLTAITYYRFECPIRNSEWMTTRKSHPSVWGLVGAATAAAVVVAILQINYSNKIALIEQEVSAARDVVAYAPPPMLAPSASTSHILTPLTSPVPGNSPCYGAPAMLDPACKLRNPEISLTPSVDALAAERGAPGFNCWTNPGESFNTCSKGYFGDAATRIAVVGDSHAAMLFAGLAPYLQAMKWQLTFFVGSRCAWHTDPPAECRAAIDTLEPLLMERRFDAVITTHQRSRPAPAPDRYAQVWRPLAAAGTKIVAVVDNPSVMSSVLTCVERGDVDGGCGMPRSQALARPDQFKAAAELVPGAYAVDLTQYYCNVSRCPAVIGDVIVYRDNNHVTTAYMRTLGPALVDGIRKALAGPL